MGVLVGTEQALPVAAEADEGDAEPGTPRERRGRDPQDSTSTIGGSGLDLIWHRRY